MSSMRMVTRGLELIRILWKPFLLVVIGLDLPPILGEALSVEAGYLTPEMATPVWALLGLVLIPISHGAILLLLKAQYDGQKLSVREALQGGIRVWGKYQVAYLYLSFLVLGWLAVFTLPALGVMMMLGLKQVWLLAPFAAAGFAYAVIPLTFQEAYFVTKDLSPWDARMMSRLLVRGHVTQILGIGLATITLPLALEFAPDLAAQGLGLDVGWGQGFLKAVFGTASAFLYIVPTAAFYVLFRELESHKKESFVPHAEAVLPLN